MFGYTKRDVIGANINVLIPEPIATVHQQYMQHYIRSGQEAMLTNSRTMFGKHRNGYIFPLLENAKAMDDGLAGAIRKLPTNDDYIFFYSKCFVIPEASQGSFLALGVSPLVQCVTCVATHMLLQRRDTYQYMLWSNNAYRCVMCCCMCPGYCR